MTSDSSLFHRFSQLFFNAVFMQGTNLLNYCVNLGFIGFTNFV